MDEMVTNHKVDIGTGNALSIPAIETQFYQAVEAWFVEHRSKLSANHFVKIGLVRIYRNGPSTIYKRKADLCLGPEIAHTTNGEDKILIEGAVTFSAEWRNGKA